MPILGVIASQISGHLFAPSGAYDSIATTTIGSGGASSITFSSIPQTYTHLQLRGIARCSRTEVSENISMAFNSDGISGNTNYTYHAVSGDGATASSFGAGDFTRMIPALISGANASANVFGGFVIDILDYTNTNKFTTVRSLNGIDNNGSGSIRLTSDLYKSTSAISTITFAFAAGSTFNQYSQIALYGIKGN